MFRFLRSDDSPQHSGNSSGDGMECVSTQQCFGNNLLKLPQAAHLMEKKDAELTTPVKVASILENTPFVLSRDVEDHSDVPGTFAGNGQNEYSSSVYHATPQHQINGPIVNSVAQNKLELQFAQEQAVEFPLALSTTNASTSSRYLKQKEFETSSQNDLVSERYRESIQAIHGNVSQFSETYDEHQNFIADISRTKNFAEVSEVISRYCEGKQSITALSSNGIPSGSTSTCVMHKSNVTAGHLNVGFAGVTSGGNVTDRSSLLSGRCSNDPSYSISCKAGAENAAVCAAQPHQEFLFSHEHLSEMFSLKQSVSCSPTDLSGFIGSITTESVHDGMTDGNAVYADTSNCSLADWGGSISERPVFQDCPTISEYALLQLERSFSARQTGLSVFDDLNLNIQQSLQEHKHEEYPASLRSLPNLEASFEKSDNSMSENGTNVQGLKDGLSDVLWNHAVHLLHHASPQSSPCTMNLPHWVSIDQVSNVASKDKDGDTVMHVLIAAGVTQITEILIKSVDADSLNVQNRIGQTPLHVAMCAQQVHVAKLLIAYGADISLTESKGNTALHLACEMNSLELVSCLFEKDWVVGNYDKYLKLLNYKNHKGLGAVHIATMKKNLPVLKCLRNQNANMNLQDDRSGQTSLVIAIQQGQWEIAKELIAFNVDVNVATFSGNTALHYASSANQVDLMALLFDHGANVSCKNAAGKTAKDVAGSENLKTILKKRSRQVCKRRRKASTAEREGEMLPKQKRK